MNKGPEDGRVSKRDLDRLNYLLQKIGDEDRRIDHFTSAHQRRVEASQARLAEDTDILVASRGSHVDEAVRLYTKLIDLGVVQGKTLELPFGTVSARTTESVVIKDERGLMAAARRLSIVTKISVPKPRVLDKNLIKRFFDSRPRLWSKLEEYVVKQKKTTITVKPRSSDVTVSFELKGLTPLQRAKIE